MPARGQKKPPADRFWSKVDRRGPDECWPWLAVKVAGYGQILNEDGTRIYAHRASLILAGRPTPSHLDVLHSCNNPSCVNPAHLRAGTAADNAADCIAAGRFKHNPAPRGESNPQHILTENAVRYIRASLGKSNQELAVECGVSRAMIRKIKRYEAWVCVP